MEVSVLGPVDIALTDAPIDLGTPKQRALVAALALSRGWPVSVDRIVDLLWEDDPPPGVSATLQAYVSQLRRVIEPDRPRRAPGTILVTVAPGYALRVPEECVDSYRFEETVDGAHRRLQSTNGWGPPPLAEPELTTIVGDLDRALALWRGTPYAELGDADAAIAERARLEELRVVGLEDRAVAELALGQHATVAAELEALTATHPLRERLWALRALALARSGRQADALDVLREVREVLDGELGLEPSAQLRDLQTAVLRQDPAIDWQPVGPVTPTAPAPPDPGLITVPQPALDDQIAPWPMVGRDAELGALLDALARAETGMPAYVALTGEPGIGKSRLAAELVLRARRNGAFAWIGRGSQDEGAPPLWPWQTVMDGLGMSLLSGGEAESMPDEGGRFRAWERIVESLRDAARTQTIAVVMDDLHWADTSTLRVLRLLVESVDHARLLLVATWRPHPEPTGALADLAESLARAHALRVELSGLPAAEAAHVFESVTSRGLSETQAAALRERTDGTPFLRVEFARLAAERPGPTAGPPEELPTAVTEVLNRRLRRLPDDTVKALRAASVLGRSFDSATLAAVTGIDEDDLLDVVEPAQAAGLVREEGIDRHRFTHALVRDTLRSGTSASRRARIHARAAEALDGTPGRETEVARHWHEAGPSYAGRAWRSAVAAAALASRYFAYDEAAAMLHDALVSQDSDGGSGLRERYDVLVALIEAYRWSAQLPDLVRTVEEAIEVGIHLDDPEAIAEAAVSTSLGVLWRSAPAGEINERVVGALRDSLEALPSTDSALRCHTLLALANELADFISHDDRRELCDAGLAMARRLDDPALLLDACQLYFVAMWQPETARSRLGLIDEARELAELTGNRQAHVVASTLRAGVLSELGHTREMWVAAAQARAEAQEQRIAFGEIVLDGLELPWLAMAGKFDECEQILDHLVDLGDRISHDNADEALMASELALRLWQGRSLEMVPVLERFDESAYPFSASLAVYFWRAGEHDLAREVYDARGAPLDHDNDVSMLAWCHAAELALYLDVSEIAEGAYERLAPLAGMNCCSGAALALGPVDAYLAMAAAARGDLECAARHADDALALADDWGIPVYADWVRQTRETYRY